MKDVAPVVIPPARPARAPTPATAADSNDNESFGNALASARDGTPSANDATASDRDEPARDLLGDPLPDAAPSQLLTPADVLALAADVAKLAAVPRPAHTAPLAADVAATNPSAAATPAVSTEAEPPFRGAPAAHAPTATATLAPPLPGSDAKDNVKTVVAPTVERTPLDASVTATPNALPSATIVRDRLLEDFERRFERALSASTTAAPRADAALLGQTPLTASLSAAHASITVPVGDTGFRDAFAQRVVLMTHQNVQSAQISVTPADLGPVSVTIEVRGSEAALSFTASNAQTRAAIEDALPRLREMLAAGGLNLAQTHVGDQRRPQGDGRSQGAPARRGEPARDIAAIAVPDADNTNLRSVRLIDVHV